MKYLLDTDTCIYLLNGRHPSLSQRFLSEKPERIAISSVTAGELFHGAMKSARVKENLRKAQIIVGELNVLPYSVETARCYGELRTGLEKRGTPIGTLDTLIAATALALRLILVSNNEKEFRRVPGLRLENWARAS